MSKNKKNFRKLSVGKNPLVLGHSKLGSQKPGSQDPGRFFKTEISVLIWLKTVFFGFEQSCTSFFLLTYFE
jgi:hypothetical protein